MVERSDEMLSTKHSRYMNRWGNSLRKMIRHSIPRSNGTLWSRDSPPISTKRQNKLHQFSSEVLPFFIGYALNAGGGWTGDLLVADAEAFKKNTASELYVKRFKEKEVAIQKVSEQFRHISLC